MNNITYKDKEDRVINYINNVASCDELADLYAYMNCVKVEYHITDSQDDDILSVIYNIVESDNDDADFQVNEKFALSEANRYLDSLLTTGTQDDIECMYNHITV
jgi:hypothetical protein